MKLRNLLPPIAMLATRTGAPVFAAIVTVVFLAATTHAQLAYWRFTGGPDQANFPHGAAPGYNYAPDVADASGNGNALSIWDTGGGTGYKFRTNVPWAIVPQTGAANASSVQNTGGFPATFTNPAGPLRPLELSQWTIEASWKPENGGFRTVVGRDGRGVTSLDGNLASLYLQAQPDNSLAIKFTDEAGNFHQAISAPGVVTGFNFGGDPNGTSGTWHNIAAVSDGSTLSLWLDKGTGYNRVATANLTGSANSRLTNGSTTVGGVAGDTFWTAGDWSVGRGMYAGGHGDRAYGLIDEVRISDTALSRSEFLGVAAASGPGTVAHWRFEGGPAGADVPKLGPAGFNYSPDIPDASGNGNELSVWTQGGCCGFAFRSDVPGSTIPQTGDANNFSIKNTGAFPSTFTESAGTMSTLELSQWTIEASWKPENGGFRTVVGRDAQGVSSSDGNLAALYLGAAPDNSLLVRFTDEAGFTHLAQSAPGAVTGFDFGTDPDGLTGVWHNIAATSDGETLSLYLDTGDGYELVALTDLLASGSTDTRLTDGFNDIGGIFGAADWAPGAWSVGRGLYAGGHADRAYGFIDEVRISNIALSPDQFIFFTPEPASIVLWLVLGIAVGGLGYRQIRKTKKLS